MQMYTNTLLDNLMSGVISVGPDGVVQSVNQHALRLLKKESSEVLMQPFTVLPAAIQNHIDSLIKQDTQGDAADRLWIGDLNGPRRLLSVRSSRIPARQDGKTTIILIDDITDQTRLEEQMQRNQRLTAMRNLASSVAHEIKNPLNSIKLIVDLFRKKYKAANDTAALSKQLDTASGEIDRISAIIDHYLKFARMPVLHRIPVQLNKIADEVVTLFDESLKKKNIHLQQSFQPHPPLLGDPDQIRQVFINLLKNAQEAIDGTGIITFTGIVAPPVYEIRVTDTGKGIADKDKSFIFDFHYTTKKDGSGIGLSLVQHIMSAHGGDVQVASSVGEGTTFILHFPLAEQKRSAESSLQTEGV
jgi:signal transduction histidine kinase